MYGFLMVIQQWFVGTFQPLHLMFSANYYSSLRNTVEQTTIETQVKHSTLENKV